MKMRFLTLACAAALASISGAAIAEDGPFTISANVAMTTDYVWRGISQTSEDPAIQGGFDLEHESGIYLGGWGSNVDFGPGDPADLELDVYGGFTKEFDNGFGFDIGLIHYDFPDVSDYATEEIYLGASYSFFSAKFNHNLDGNYNYYEAGAEFDLPQEFGLNMHIGYNDPDAGDGATDWKIGVTKELFGLGFELAYTDTDINDVPEADARAVFTVSKEF